MSVSVLSDRAANVSRQRSIVRVETGSPFLFEIIRMMRDEGIAVLIVEQFVESALEVADRAYVFEKQLNSNVDNVFDKRLKDYESAESGAIIPMMIFTPTIVNDGRRLLVSPHDISFLSHDQIENER